MGPRNPNAAALLLLILMPGWNDNDRGLRKGVTNTRCVRYGWGQRCDTRENNGISNLSRPTTMSSNLKNDGLVGLQNDDLNRDGLAIVVDKDNCEFKFEGKSYRL